MQNNNLAQQSFDKYVVYVSTNTPLEISLSEGWYFIHLQTITTNPSSFALYSVWVSDNGYATPIIRGTDITTPKLTISNGKLNCSLENIETGHSVIAYVYKMG